MRHIALTLFFTGCGSAAFYDVDVQGIVTDLDGEPIIDQPYTLCAKATFDDDEEVDGGCGSGTTTDLGEVAMDFSTTATAQLVRVTSTLTVADTEMVHEGSGQSTPRTGPVNGIDVLVDSAYSMDRELLPQRTTRFDIGGFVSSIDDVVGRTGTMAVFASIEPGATPDFQGSSPVSTDSEGGVQVDVDLVSDWDFPISNDRTRLVMTLDGQTLEGQFDILSAESGEPRMVIVVATF